jgi:hypothetical protein
MIPRAAFPVVDEDQVIERMAMAIFQNEGGLGDDEDWKAMYGDKPRKLWMTDAPWDTNPAELTEWQRDDYRAQARAALAIVREELVADARRWALEQAARVAEDMLELWRARSPYATWQDCAKRIRALGQPLPAAWSVYDTQEDVWVGSASMRSPDETLARALALNLNECERRERYEARPLTPTKG